MVDSDFWYKVLIGGMSIVVTGFMALVALVIVRYMWLVIKHWYDEWY